jgi:hypothetical protein
MTGKASALAFGAAQLLMFGSISLLQIAPVQFFVPLLLTMHAGILLFIKLKRGLSANQPELTRVTRGTYVLMAMYLPILIYKLLDKLGLLHVHYPVLYSATLALAVLAVLLIVHSLRVVGCASAGRYG